MLLISGVHDVESRKLHAELLLPCQRRLLPAGAGSRRVNLTGLPQGIPHPLKEKQENYMVDGPLGFSPPFSHCNLLLVRVGLK